MAFGVVRGALGGELLLMAFGVVRAALCGELLRMVALGGVCGAATCADRLNNITSLTCFGRSGLCSDVLAVSGAHSGGASHASAAGTINLESARASSVPMLLCSPHAVFAVFSRRGPDQKCPIRWHVKNVCEQLPTFETGRTHSQTYG